MTLYLGDVRDGLRQFAADGLHAQTCVTSPPYWGLRDYGCAGQIGLESTPEEYVATLVDVFRLVRDVLAEDGTCWVNLGDSYSGSWGDYGGQNRGHGKQREIIRGSAAPNPAYYGRQSTIPPTARVNNLKAKDLIGIPWRVAFALQADGWWLRSDIIWHKPNPMPESVTDRPTKSHEYVFLLAKSERYYYDAAAIAESSLRAGDIPGGDNMRGVGVMGVSPHAAFNGVVPDRRNRRTVWTIPTSPYPEAHFATFPPALVEPCILAGSRVGDIVLDPFMGAGTVAMVAEKLGRRWAGCELNPDYARLLTERTRQTAMALA